MSEKSNTMMTKLNRTPSVDIDFSERDKQALSVDGRIMKNMKPLPRDKNAVRKEAILLGLVGANPSLEQPRAKLVSFINDSDQIGRSLNHVSVLLVGKSGVGKSSTINHLLGKKIETETAKTSNLESETRSTQEFVLFGDEPRYEVKDLPLGVVDTPGIGDTDGPKQEAANLLSIKNFFETHEKLSECYPNLIFLLVNADDTRIKGKNSDLLKALRLIKKFDLVDPKYPNVVTVLTKACSIPFGKPQRWSEKINERKEIVSKIVSEALKVTAPVVALENHYDEDNHDLDICGDYTRLPNDVLQPKNLYEACAEVLTKNSDHLAPITLNSIFAAPREEPPKPGHKIDANADMEKCGLSAVGYLQLLESEGSTDFISDKVQEFIDKGDFSRKEQDELQRIGFALKKVAYGNQQDFSSISIAIIEYFYEGEISPIGRKMLEEKFGVATKPATADAGPRLVGQGYNILTDKSVAAQVMKFHGTQTKYGIVVPECATVEIVEDTRSYMDVFETEKSYTEARLRNLNVNLTVVPNILMSAFRAGCNKIDQSSSSISELSFLFEQRMFELKIGNYKEYLKSKMMSFTLDFESSVEDLPNTYDKEDARCRNAFKQFFDRFGHFLVAAAYGGGSVELKCSREIIGKTKTKVVEAKAHFIAAFQNARCPKAEVSSGASSSDDLNAETLLSKCEDFWKGGNILLRAKETIADKGKMQNWKVSLLDNHTMLTSEMTLDPISNAVACVNKEKGQVTYDALKDLLGGEFKTFAEREKADREEEYRKRREAITTRVNTVHQPKKKDDSCFPSNSVVSVTSKDGVKTQKKMADLRVGEKVMAWNEKRNRAVFTEVIMFAHRETDAKDVKYLKITLEDGTKITLSTNHLVVLGKLKKAIMAQIVKLGDILFTVDENQEISAKKVLSIDQVIEQGVYCPITSHGNVIVDNVLVSCYASLQDHVFLRGLVKVSAQRLAHLGLMPMRVLHKLRLKRLREIPDGEGIHPYLQWLCKLKLPFMAN